MNGKKTGRLYQLAWFNPYTTPPDNAPRVLADIFVPHEAGKSIKPPPELLAVPHSPGGGYSLVSRHVSPPSKQLSREGLARVRRKRLARRVNAKVPMFAAHFITAELARKPDYYDGVTDPGIAQRALSALEREWEDWLDFWSRPNKLIIYGQEPEACRLRAEKIYQEMKAVDERFRSGAQP